ILSTKPPTSEIVIGFTGLESDSINFRITIHRDGLLILKITPHAVVEPVRQPPVALFRGRAKACVAKLAQQLWQLREDKLFLCLYDRSLDLDQRGLIHELLLLAGRYATDQEHNSHQ